MQNTNNETQAPGSGANPNHHLWNNHGTWFLCYTEHPTPFTKQRIRRSLKTRSVEEARRRRDEFFARRCGPAPDRFTRLALAA
jgi:hypothetical protein